MNVNTTAHYRIPRVGCVPAAAPPGVFEPEPDVRTVQFSRAVSAPGAACVEHKQLFIVLCTLSKTPPGETTQDRLTDARKHDHAKSRQPARREGRTRARVDGLAWTCPCFGNRAGSKRFKSSPSQVMT